MSRRRTLAVVVAAAAVLWALVNGPVEGPTLVRLNNEHGLTLADLLSIAGGIFAISLWRRPLRRSPGPRLGADPGERRRGGGQRLLAAGSTEPANVRACCIGWVLARLCRMTGRLLLPAPTVRARWPSREPGAEVTMEHAFAGTAGPRKGPRPLVRPVGVVNGDRWKRAVCATAGPLLVPVTSLAAVSTRDPVFGLTFDDGPDVVTTPAVLDTLARHHARATFFMLADRAEAHPELARSVVLAGHEVALHGDDHTKLASLPAREAQARIARARQRLEDVAGTRVRFFRFPCGDQRLTDVLRARRLGLDVAVWTTSAGDYKPLDVTVTVERVARALFPGAVVLLHDGYESGARPDPVGPKRGELVDQLLSTLERGGLWPTTLSELCAGRQPIRVPWLSGRFPEWWRAQHRRVSASLSAG